MICDFFIEELLLVVMKLTSICVHLLILFCLIDLDFLDLLVSCYFLLFLFLCYYLNKSLYCVHSLFN